MLKQDRQDKQEKKPLSKHRRLRRRFIIIILSVLLFLMVLLLAFTDIRGDINFVVHFFTPPKHFTFSGHSDGVNAVAWSPDSKHIASASNDGTVHVWDAATGKHLFTVSSTPSVKGGLIPWYTVAWSPDGKHIAIGGIGDVELLDATTGHQVATYGYHGGSVYIVAWSHDGT